MSKELVASAEALIERYHTEGLRSGDCNYSVELLQGLVSQIAIYETAIRQWREKLEQPEPGGLHIIETFSQPVTWTPKDV